MSSAAQSAKRRRLDAAGASAAQPAQQLSGFASGGASSGIDGRDGSQAASAATGPLSGLRLLFWRLKHAKPLVEKVCDRSPVTLSAFMSACSLLRFTGGLHCKPLLHEARGAGLVQAQRQGAIVHQSFSPDTDFAVVAPRKQTSELLQDLAEQDRCQTISSHAACACCA